MTGRPLSPREVATVRHDLDALVMPDPETIRRLIDQLERTTREVDRLTAANWQAQTILAMTAEHLAAGADIRQRITNLTENGDGHD